MTYKPFSIRQGFVKADEVVQLDKMNSRLENSIYNYCKHLIETNFFLDSYSDDFTNTKIKENYIFVWENFFFKITGTLFRKEVVEEAYLTSPFFKKYDFLEFIMNHFSNQLSEDYNEINQILESSTSGYRFIKKILEPISSKREIETINKSLNSGIDGNHIELALKELAKRENQNLNIVVTESINAVEMAAKNLCTDLYESSDSLNLSKYLKIMSENGLLDSHSAYIESLKKLYGYSSDGGFRHPKQTDYKVDIADAKFMLSVCSAFVSYIKEKYAYAKNK